jgi:hypothetical protein
LLGAGAPLALDGLVIATLHHGTGGGIVILRQA